jgi:uncharacterized membrane protein YjjP (DUF1212 family)
MVKTKKNFGLAWIVVFSALLAATWVARTQHGDDQSLSHGPVASMLGKLVTRHVH